MMSSTAPPGRLSAISVIAGLAYFAVLQIAAWKVAGRVFEYPLDDPYIHLAMAEQMAAGGYGVNPGDYASAASSAFYPVLLMPFAGEAVQRWLPLFWNMIGLIAAAWLWGRILLKSGYGTGRLGLALAVSGPILLNMSGLAFTGMEHALHVAASLGIVLGLIRFLDTGQVGVALVMGVGLAPLMRFEGLALALLASGAVMLKDRIGPGLALAALSVVPIAVFCLFLVSLGLDPLPNSVSAKLALPADPTTGWWAHYAERFAANPEKIPFYILLAQVVIAVALFFVRDIRRSSRVALLFVLFGMGAAHLIAGRYGWMDRYEVYVVASMTAGFFALVSVTNRLLPRAVVGLPMLAAGALYLSHALDRTIWAPRAVHMQQAQMARFAKEHWKAPVAVNDLGQVSWRNSEFGLDLWGLASREAQRLRLYDAQPGWAGRLTRAEGVKLAMIYDDIFTTAKGDDWVRVGDLTFAGPTGGVSGRTVGFFATTPTAVGDLGLKLRSWQKDLPRGAAFQFATEATQ